LKTCKFAKWKQCRKATNTSEYNSDLIVPEKLKECI
jgi:hypothetical protein